MRRVGIGDFIPPIVPRAWKYARRRLRRRPPRPSGRLHPFDCVPSSIDAKWVLDVGANVGDVAIAALESYAGCRVVCFEPVTSTFEVLQARLLPYGERAHLYRKAASNFTGEGEINLTSHPAANSILPQSLFHKSLNPQVREVGRERIEMVRLDDIASELPCAHIDIMKIDVEGYELAVLEGARDLVAGGVDTVIVEIALMRDQSWEKQAVVDVFCLMRSLGFRLINVVDLNYAAEGDLMVAQMDCVFRALRFL